MTPETPTAAAGLERFVAALKAGLFLLEQAVSYVYAGALRTAAIIKVADQLVDGPKHVDELARACGTDPLKLYRVLRLLATRGVFRELER